MIQPHIGPIFIILSVNAGICWIIENSLALKFVVWSQNEKGQVKETDFFSKHYDKKHFRQFNRQ